MTERDAAIVRFYLYLAAAFVIVFNPVKVVWSHIKRSLANLAKRNRAELSP